MKKNNKIFNEFIEDLWQYNMKENNLKKILNLIYL